MNERVGGIVTPPHGIITRLKLEKNLLPVDQDNFGKENNNRYSVQVYAERQYWTLNSVTECALHHLTQLEKNAHG